MPDLNAPNLVAELTRLHDAYEQALVSNDVNALAEFFWLSPEVVRFGTAEQLYGAEEIAAYRKVNRPAFTRRALRKRKILVIGSDVASVMSEYDQVVAGKPQVSRQSQVWVKFETGWRIVSAHVSAIAA